jgi:hypothetical protein
MYIVSTIKALGITISFYVIGNFLLVRFNLNSDWINMLLVTLSCLLGMDAIRHFLSKPTLWGYNVNLRRKIMSTLSFIVLCVIVFFPSSLGIRIYWFELLSLGLGFLVLVYFSRSGDSRQNAA